VTLCRLSCVAAGIAFSLNAFPVVKARAGHERCGLFGCW
jgi:hypothetical protein